MKLLSRVRLFATPWTHGSSIHGIFQARILEWFAISFSRGSSQPRDQTQVSCIAARLFTAWASKRKCTKKEQSRNKSALIKKGSVPHQGLGCCDSVTQSCLFATPWTAARQALLSFTISRSLLKLKSIESLMPSNPSHPLSPPSPPALNLSQCQGLQGIYL